MLQSLGFADVREGDIFLTPPARAFADGDVQARKVLFAEHLLRYVPLAALIKTCWTSGQGTARRACVSSRSWRTRCRTAPPKTLDTVINWGRYGEIFSYNDQTAFFSLEDVEF